MSARRRAPTPAKTDAFWRGMLRAAYIDHFVSVPRIQRWLDERSRPYRRPAADPLAVTGEERARRLAADVEAIVARLCLIATDELHRGIADWLVSGLRPEHFATFAGGFTGVETPIGDIETGRELAGVSPSGRPIIGIIQRPLVRIDLQDEWDPSAESRQAARARILGRCARAVDAELNRIERHAESLGYRFADTQPNVRRDIEWLVAVVRDRRTYRQLAGAAGLTEKAVRMAVRRLAETIGVTLPDGKF